MKKRIVAVILMLVCIWQFVLPALAEDEVIKVEPVEIENCNAATVYNIENEQFIYELDADKIIYPASTVKLMTAIIVIEALNGDLKRMVSVQGGSLIDISGNSIGLKHGEIMTAEQLLYALLCGCANDAASALAWEIAGSTEAFVEMMNQKAKEIGALNTVYTNPTGMHDPDMVTTAKDTAIVAAYALQLSPIADMSSVEKFVIPQTNIRSERTIYNKNYYFASNREYKYIWRVPKGLNSGYTDEGGYCMVTSATREGLTYIAVVMGATADDEYIYSYTEAADLIKWAFNAYSRTTVLSTFDPVCEVPVRLAGKVDYVTLFPSETVELFLPRGIDVKQDVKIDISLESETLTAPVSEEHVGGRLTVSFNGTELGTYDLITRNSVNRNNILYILDLVLGFMAGEVFKTLLIFVGIAASLYVLGWGVVYFSREKERNRRER